jgi:hypothetical protein
MSSFFLWIVDAANNVQQWWETLTEGTDLIAEG